MPLFPFHQLFNERHNQAKSPRDCCESEAISLRRGDVLVLYTDGAVEAENPAGEQYSAERLARTVGLHPEQRADELIETIYASVIQFRETASLADDSPLWC